MNTRNSDYRRLLDDCIKLYEELERTMDEIDLLVTDIKLPQKTSMSLSRP